MLWYHDIETDEYLTRDQLIAEFFKLKALGETESETPYDYIKNCTDKNGTLTIVHTV